ncbi:hypothetical protein FOL47_005065 [Perkinsus chesapeaki]|uniref:NIPA-like protein 3 n=1 Tax=Perkinsus chesapeaki TaxID=330153 RepID=A0A7J6LZ59_PERCH|nr:hypothetical protein FOL47_005065 [Perkinsus chesapeaki]
MPRSSVQLLQPLLSSETPLSIQDLATNEREPSTIAITHLLLFVSQWLAAGNYVFYRSFYNQEEEYMGYYAAPVYSLIRGILALSLIPILYWTSRPSLGQILTVPTSEQKAAMIEGIAGAIRQNLIPLGLMFTDATSAGIVQPFVPIGSTMLAVFLGLEKGNKYKYLSILVGIAGVLIAGRLYALHEIDVGFIILLGVPITKAAQLTEQRVAMTHMDRAALHIQQLLVLAVFTAVLVYIVFTGDSSMLWTYVKRLGGVGWASIAYSVVFVLLIEWWIQLKAVRVIGPITVGLYQVLQPCCCFILCHIVLGESYHTHQLIGAALMCTALAIHCLVQFENPPRHPTTDQRRRHTPPVRLQRATVAAASSKRARKITIGQRATTGI